MITLEKMEAMKQIKKEFDEMNKFPNINIGAFISLIDLDDIFKWRASLRGPKDSSYKGGLFILNITFPDNYPKEAPAVCFKTPIYHLNVNPQKSNIPGAEPLGHVSISTLIFWKPYYKIKEVLINIFGLLYKPNPDSPYGLNRAEELRSNRQLYEEKIKFFTQKYANPKNVNIDKEYNESWDFTYPQ